MLHRSVTGLNSGTHASCSKIFHGIRFPISLQRRTSQNSRVDYVAGSLIIFKMGEYLLSFRFLKPLNSSTLALKNLHHFFLRFSDMDKVFSFNCETVTPWLANKVTIQQKNEWPKDWMGTLEKWNKWPISTGKRSSISGVIREEQI